MTPAASARSRHRPNPGGHARIGKTNILEVRTWQVPAGDCTMQNGDATEGLGQSRVNYL
jgi:hypothetical protein